MRPDIKASVARFAEDVEKLYQDNRFVVFLCGPKLGGGKDSAKLRKQVSDELLADGFEVVLGEDDGLEELREQYNGLAHQNELSFIQKEACAIVLIADSVGSFCELGLFSYTHYTENPSQVDLLLLVDEEHQGEESYFNEGPAAAVDTMGGKVFHGDFSAFDTAPILDRLQKRRAIWFAHGKGRPSGS